ncbi:MAG: hypothetical protein AB1797_00185 [bacterium]
MRNPRGLSTLPRYQVYIRYIIGTKGSALILDTRCWMLSMLDTGSLCLPRVSSIQPRASSIQLY